MKSFSYARANSSAEAAAAAARIQGSKFIAGGTNLLDLMKIEVETPTHLVDVQDLGFDTIEKTADGGLRIGALVTNTNLAADARCFGDGKSSGGRRRSRSAWATRSVSGTPMSGTRAGRSPRTGNCA